MTCPWLPGDSVPGIARRCSSPQAPAAMPRGGVATRSLGQWTPVGARSGRCNGSRGAETRHRTDHSLVVGDAHRFERADLPEGSDLIADAQRLELSFEEERPELWGALA